MDGFKPLLKINGFPMITMTVQSLRNAGIRDIIVVTGYRGEEVEKVLEPMGVSSMVAFSSGSHCARFLPAGAETAG